MFVRLLLIVVLAATGWGFFVRASDGAGHERTYVVRPGDTLWSIAERSYGGDPRAGVWRLRERNGLEGVLLRPGQRLAVPGA